MKLSQLAIFAAGLAAAATLAATPTLTQEIKLTFADQNSPTGWGPPAR